jgi:threonine aldolase
VRKRWGGGMRQVGILAAACLTRSTTTSTGCADDHRRARDFAARISGRPGVVVREPETNIVFIDSSILARPEPEVLALVESWRAAMAAAVRSAAACARSRHLDVDDAGIARAAADPPGVVEERTRTRRDRAR